MIFRISRIQFMYLMLWVVLATGILTMPLAVAKFTFHDGWISAVFFMFGTLVSAVVVKLFVAHFPSQTLSEALLESLGPWVGRVFVFWFVLWLLIQAALMARQFLVFAEITILPTTPLPVIAGVFFIPIAYSVFLGLEVIARFTEFITPLAGLVALVIIVLIAPAMHPDLLLPVLADGWSPVLRAAVQPAVAFALQLILALEILPHLQHAEKVARDVMVIGTVVTAIFIVMEIVIITALGLTAHYLQYPILEVVRGIRIGRFIQRFDTLYVLGIIATIIIKVSFYQYCFIHSLQTLVGLSSMRMLTLGAVAVTGAASIYLWRDSVELAHYMLSVTPAYFAATLVSLPVIAVAAKRFHILFAKSPVK